MSVCDHPLSSRLRGVVLCSEKNWSAKHAPRQSGLCWSGRPSMVTRLTAPGWALRRDASRGTAAYLRATGSSFGNGTNHGSLVESAHLWYSSATLHVTNTYDKHLLAAVDAVERAGRLCKAVRAAFIAQDGASIAGTLNKTDRSPVTVADFSCQALISLELGAAFPSVPFVAEEDAAALRASDSKPLLSRVTQLVSEFSSLGAVTDDQVLAAIDRGLYSGDGGGQHWVLDPIDGTKGFLDPLGQCQYVIGLALIEGSEAVLGVMGVPNWSRHPLPAACDPGVTVAAAAGLGSWWRRMPQSASRIANLASQTGEGAEASPAQGCPTQSPHPLGHGGWERCRLHPADVIEEAVVCISDHEEWDSLPMTRGLAPRSPVASKRICCGSLCKYAAIALGDASAFVQHPVEGKYLLKVWDHAAGVTCVVEAGGAVTDFAGRPLALAPGRDFAPAGLGVLVSNGSIHSDALRSIVVGSGGGGLFPRDVTGTSVPSPKAGSFSRLLVLLDRDGVLNEDLGTWCLRKEDLKLISGSAEAVAQINLAGHAVAVVTNQSCVGRGLLSLSGLADIHGQLRADLAAEGGARIDCLVFSDAEPGGVSANFRKPAPGMLIEAMGKLGFSDPTAAVMIGDTVSDMKAAAAIGVRRMMVCTGHGKAVGLAAAALGWSLPRMLSEADSIALGKLVPSEVLPLELHVDLRSATRSLLSPGSSGILS